MTLIHLLKLQLYFICVSDKVRKKYANLGHSIAMVQLERSSQGLGLSLAGHKDRNCMAVFVCGLNPKGSAYKTGGIEVGDEILEVRNVRRIQSTINLLGMLYFCPEKVSTLVKLFLSNKCSNICRQQLKRRTS